jgi:glucokinase
MGTGRWLRLGLDVGGTKVALALGDDASRVVARARIPFPATGDPARDIAKMFEAAERLLAERGASLRELEAVGLAVPGPLDAARGRVLSPPNLPGWHEVELAERFRAATGARVAVENDADAAALAEWRHGAARGSEHAVYLTMSTGVGGGLVLGGRLHRGALGAGEIGHAPVEWEGEPCACGLRGCLEAYVGGAAWARHLRAVATADGRVAALAGGRERIRPEHLLAAARERDAFALAELARWNGYLARGLVWLAMVVSPEVIVLGTIARAAGEALCLSPLRELVARHTWPRVARGVRIVASELGDELPERAALAVAELALSQPR